jgi:hypothetical protein
MGELEGQLLISICFKFATDEELGELGELGKLGELEK